MVDEFFKSFLEGSNIKTPEAVLEAFINKFSGTVNTEWFKVEDLYEAVFYHNGIEKIAKFSGDGTWHETGINTDKDLIPSAVKSAAEKNGEIMSSIEFRTAGSSKFEIVVRDSQMNRFLLIINDSGKLIKNKPII